MKNSRGDGIHRAGRWATVTLQHRQVWFDASDERRAELSYAGVLIAHYDAGEKVSEVWVPLGVDPSEADDEELIQNLRCALLWQADKQPDTGSTRES